MVKLIVKIADTAINGHKNMFARNMRHPVLISSENRARENAFGWTGRLCHVNANEFHSGTKLVPEWKSFRNHVNRPLISTAVIYRSRYESTYIKCHIFELRENDLSHRSYVYGIRSSTDHVFCSKAIGTVGVSVIYTREVMNVSW